jgi:hypothetical protein
VSSTASPNKFADSVRLFNGARADRLGPPCLPDPSFRWLCADRRGPNGSPDEVRDRCLLMVPVPVEVAADQVSPSRAPGRSALSRALASSSWVSPH